MEKEKYMMRAAVPGGQHGIGHLLFMYKSLRLSNRPADLFHNYGYGKPCPYLKM